MAAQKATIAMVAKHAGVSVASVSRVINGTLARPATEEKVRAAIAELGFQPNSAARALKVRESEQICLSFADIGNPAYLTITQGINSVLRDTKYRLILSSSLGTADEIHNHLQSLGRGYADGLIISPITSTPEIAQAINSLTVPTVLIGTLPKDVLVDNVYIDSAKGIELAVAHLREIGCKKIALVNGPLSTNPGRRRHQGFVDAMNKVKLKYDDSSIYFARDFTSQAATELLEKDKTLHRYDAVLCTNDLLAAGVIRNLQSRSVRVGEDISVIGMDNTELCTLLNPSLTSVDLRAERRGQLAAELLLERIKNPLSAPRKIEVKPELVIRESTNMRAGTRK